MQISVSKQDETEAVMADGVPAVSLFSFVLG